MLWKSACTYRQDGSYGVLLFSPHGIHLNFFSLLIQYLSVPRYNSLKLIESNESVLRFNLIRLYGSVELFNDLLREIDNLNLEKSYVSKVLDFENLKEAVNVFKADSTTVKVVVKLFNRKNSVNFRQRRISICRYCIKDSTQVSFVVLLYY
jgi:hypothetical protein